MSRILDMKTGEVSVRLNLFSPPVTSGPAFAEQSHEPDSFGQVPEPPQKGVPPLSQPVSRDSGTLGQALERSVEPIRDAPGRARWCVAWFVADVRVTGQPVPEFAIVVHVEK
jgi:hypothetical protein